jgi:type IV pilus assembly protein PilA
MRIPDTCKPSAINSFRGFTLLEILLVVAAIAILAGIVIVAINPAKQLAETRDAQRRSDVNAISSAIAQYSIKYGSFPDSNIHDGTDCTASYDSTDYAICSGGGCGGVDLAGTLVPEFIPSIPADPSMGFGDAFSGYTVMFPGNSRVLVCAPRTEEDEQVISVTR